MAEAVSIHEAKTHLSRLTDRAHHGEEITISKGGVPWARLVPLVEPAPRAPGQLAGPIGEAWLAPLTEEELGAWEPNP
jgi:prevent-host-death family protein